MASGKVLTKKEQEKKTPVVPRSHINSEAIRKRRKHIRKCEQCRERGGKQV